MDREELLEKLDDPYRMACPEGHTTLVPNARKRTVQCRTCNRSYAYEQLVDKAATEPATGGHR